MYIYPSAYRQFNIVNPVLTVSKPQNKTELTPVMDNLLTTFCESFKLPDDKTNYCVFDEEIVQKIVSYKENAVQPVVEMLRNTEDEKNASAGLFLLNRIFDSGVKGLYRTYPVISKFNYHDSPNVQVMLAGIYRKTLVPDAFGPLMSMFLKNAKTPVTKPFDPNEEIGGAILEYLRVQNSQNAVNSYSNFLNR